MSIYEVYWTEAKYTPAGWFSTYENALAAIDWLKEKVETGDFYIRTRRVDVINGRFAFNNLNMLRNSDFIEDISINLRKEK